MQDLNRAVTWIPRTADGTPPAGASVWPRHMGFLTGYGSSHYHFVPDYWCPHLVIRGRGTIRVHGEEYHVAAGDCFCLWPGVPIEYFEEQEAPWEYYWMHLGGAGTEAFVRSCGFRRELLVFSAAQPKRAAKGFATMYNAFVAQQPQGIFDILAGMYALAPLLTKPNVSEATVPDSPAPLMDQALSMLDSTPHVDWNVMTLAKALHVDRSTLFRSFQVMGERPSDFIMRRKIEQAKRFLELTDAKLAAIAPHAGFRNVKYFIRVFHEQTGETPNQYRRRMRSE